MATQTARKPTRLPSMRTPNTTIANPNETSSDMSAMSVPLMALPPSRAAREIGALRSRFQSPRCRSSRIPMPRSMAAKSRNCTPMPANECA